MSADSLEQAPTPIRVTRLGPLGVAIAISFGLVYAYDLWEAIAPLLDLPAVYAAVGLDPAAVPWWPLIIGVAIVPIVFALALFIGLRRSAWEKALLYLVGLAVVACSSLVVIAVEAVVRPPF
jgi:hypothetical protein